MNSQYPNGQRPTNNRQSNPRVRSGSNRVNTAALTAKQKKAGTKKTPAWKVLVTVLILVLSVSIVLSVVLSLFGVPLFGKFSMKNILSGIGENFEPEVSGTSSWTDSETGLPVLSGNRKSKTFNFLVVGLNDDTGNNTDTLMLANYDVANQMINVVQIPRDTYINAGYNFHKINSVYAAGFNHADYGSTQTERRVAGMNELCEFIETNMTVKIDFYVLVDLSAFESFIDSLGGLKVNVPCDMDYEDPEQNLYIHLKAGEQTLSGYDAMCMVRNRHTYADADYGRMNVQKIFLSALMRQVQQNITDPTALKGIIDIMFNNVTTNLTTENCVYFATQALQVDMSRMRMLTLPTQAVSSYISVLETDAVTVVNNYLNVYDEPVTAESFDPKNRLTNTGISDLYNAYLYWQTEYDVYTADDVDQNSIPLHTFH